MLNIRLDLPLEFSCFFNEVFFQRRIQEAMGVGQRCIQEKMEVG